jgi:GT2 family glycosyltransferase
MKVTASLVLYRNDPAVYEEAIRSIIGSDAAVRLAIVDNSPVPLVSPLFAHPQVLYDHAGANLGFGAGHNRAFRAVADASDAHFIVNPDVRFGPAVVGTLVDAMRDDNTVTAVMPAIFDEAGRQQHLCKALPTPVQLIARRFVPSATLRERLDRGYEFRDLPHEGVVDIPNLSGCFLGVRSSVFRSVGGFDERYFMYMEDIDLVRRLGDVGRTLYVPAARITHGHARGSYRLSRLMFTHIRSAVRYFSKFGWMIDPTRVRRNHAARRIVAALAAPNRS